MKVSIENPSYSFDTNDVSQETRVHHAFETALQLGRHAINFASIERAPRYNEDRYENDAEHSFMLSLVAPELAVQLLPQLDSALVTQFAIVHDLVELEAGDTVTFALSESELVQKEVDERDALQRLLRSLPPHTAALVKRYEAQQEAEARFVRLVDKLLPLIANIHGPGRLVMRESFGIEDSEQLQATEFACNQRLRHSFPEEDLEVVHAIRDLLAERFQNIFENA